jgi:hypothetical protein
MNPDRCRWLVETDSDTLSDAGIHIEVKLDGVSSCIRFRLEPEDIQCFHKDFRVCADFAILVSRGDDEFEAHILEHKKTVKVDEFIHVQAQLEGAMVRLLAIAGILGIRIRAVTTYTAFCNDKISREASPEMTTMKIPVGPNDYHRAQARRSWEHGTLQMKRFGSEVRHVKVQVNENGRAIIACHPHAAHDASDAQWQFRPVAE